MGRKVAARNTQLYLAWPEGSEEYLELKGLEGGSYGKGGKGKTGSEKGRKKNGVKGEKEEQVAVWPKKKKELLAMSKSSQSRQRRVKRKKRKKKSTGKTLEGGVILGKGGGKKLRGMFRGGDERQNLSKNGGMMAVGWSRWDVGRKRKPVQGRVRERSAEKKKGSSKSRWVWEVPI